MPITVPNAVNYPNPAAALNSILLNPPTEGNRFVPFEIDWGASNMGGPNGAVYCQCAINQPATFSQICALSVDNSDCASDITFIFPDSSQTYVVPAYTPQTVFPVITNQTQFYVTSANQSSTDVTRFAALNYYPYPIAVPTTEEQDAAANSNIDATTVATTQMVAAGTNGRVEAMSVICQANNGASGGSVFEIVDGSGNVLCAGRAYSQSGSNMNVVCFALSDLKLRFLNGIQFKVLSNGIASGSTFMVNIYYRTP